MILTSNFAQYTAYQHKQSEKKEPAPKRQQTARMKTRRAVEAKQDSIAAKRDADEQAYWDSLLIGEDYNLNVV